MRLMMGDVMTTMSLGKGITLTKEMYRRMGKKVVVHEQSDKTAKGGKIFSYASARMDPRNHVRFS